MILRSFLALIGGLVILATPAVGKSNETTDAPLPGLPTFVDPDPANAPENVLLLDLSNGGMVAIRLMPQWAPAHVERIKTLTSQGFYNGVIFHRVIEGFMAQTGDPMGTGAGGSPLPDLKAEFNSMPHLRGTVSAARTSDPDSANSQFFIVFYPRFSLDRKYTVLGRVISGMEVVDRIERGEPPANPTRILRARMAAGGVAAPLAPAQPAEVAISVSDLNNSPSD
ncbi:MAG: peptidylprolyl isomerase [Alphaproteobacteria bacterium]|nr:peptidylprolyl isomerase [Alphaproteobacteria bacterium]